MIGAYRYARMYNMHTSYEIFAMATPDPGQVRDVVVARLQHRVCVCARAWVRACVRACARARVVRACTCACVRACVRARVRACVHACMRACGFGFG